MSNSGIVFLATGSLDPSWYSILPPSAAVLLKPVPNVARYGFAKRLAEIKHLTALDSLQLIKKALNLSTINYATRYSEMSDNQAINILKRLNHS